MVLCINHFGRRGPFTMEAMSRTVTFSGTSWVTRWLREEDVPRLMIRRMSAVGSVFDVDDDEELAHKLILLCRASARYARHGWEVLKQDDPSIHERSILVWTKGRVALTTNNLLQYGIASAATTACGGKDVHMKRPRTLLEDVVREAQSLHRELVVDDGDVFLCSFVLVASYETIIYEIGIVFRLSPIFITISFSCHLSH